MLSKLALTCVLLMAGQAPPSDTVYTNVRDRPLQIPMEIQAARRDEIRALQLYVSADQGASWSLSSQITPDKPGFNFLAQEDGEYWFKVVVINQQGQQDPADYNKAPVKLKMIVDTQPPVVKIVSAQRQGDELVVSWEIAQEKNPDPQSLHIEYRTADAAGWLPMSFTPNPSGTARAVLTSSAPVVVRVQFKDKAGNPTQVEKQVEGSVAPAAYTPPASEYLTRAPQPPLRPNEVPQPPPPTMEKQPLPPAPVYEQPVIATPPVVQPHVQVSGSGYASSGQVVASTKDISQGALVPPPAAPSAGNHQLPPLQLVNEREILLEYEVSKVGPSGIGSVEVWMTRDGGAKWAMFATDPDAPLATSGGKYQRTLELPGDGVYGISLVVKNKVGTGKPAPRPGDIPEMLIEVDTVAPEAAIYKPMPDPARPYTMVLLWTATDRNLGKNPITLEWSERQEGPWHMVCAESLPNTGRHNWQLPPKTPPYVYLRLTVRDTAGNVGVAVTDQPQLVDISEPEAHLTRVAPVNRKN